MHGGHWLVMWSVMREVRDLSSCVSECHGEESGAVKESLMNHNCRKDKSADGNTCNSLRRSDKSCDTTTGCEKTLPCQGEMVCCDKQWTRLNCGTMFCGC